MVIKTYVRRFCTVFGETRATMIWGAAVESERAGMSWPKALTYHGFTYIILILYNQILFFGFTWMCLFLHRRVLSGESYDDGSCEADWLTHWPVDRRHWTTIGAINVLFMVSC